MNNSLDDAVGPRIRVIPIPGNISEFYKFGRAISCVAAVTCWQNPLVRYQRAATLIIWNQTRVNEKLLADVSQTSPSTLPSLKPINAMCGNSRSLAAVPPTINSTASCAQMFSFFVIGGSPENIEIVNKKRQRRVLTDDWVRHGDRFEDELTVLAAFLNESILSVNDSNDSRTFLTSLADSPWSLRCCCRCRRCGFHGTANRSELFIAERRHFLQLLVFHQSNWAIRHELTLTRLTRRLDRASLNQENKKLERILRHYHFLCLRVALTRSTLLRTPTTTKIKKLRIIMMSSVSRLRLRLASVAI